MELEALMERLCQGDAEARDELRGKGEHAAAAAPALADAVRSGKKQLRLDALFVLEGLGAAAKPALPALLDAIRGDDMDVAATAADVLGSIGGDAVGGIIDALEDPNARVRQACCQALGAMRTGGAEAVPALLARVEADEEPVRRRAVWALGEIGDETALEPLAALLTREGGTLGCWIAQTLARYGRHARVVADALRDELHRDDAWLAVACAEALLSIGRYEEAAIWHLISRVQDDGDHDIRLEAILTLAECGSRASAALPALQSATRSTSEDLRAQANIAIAKIRPEYVAH